MTIRLLSVNSHEIIDERSKCTVLILNPSSFPFCVLLFFLYVLCLRAARARYAVRNFFFSSAASSRLIISLSLRYVYTHTGFDISTFTAFLFFWPLFIISRFIIVCKKTLSFQ
jgi:hypothetical protein